MARTATVLLLGGDYAERLSVLYGQVLEAQAAQEKLEQAETTNRTLLEQGDDPVAELAQAYNELKAEAEDEAEGARRKVTLTAVGRTVWRELKAKHPVRTEGPESDVEADQRAGVNVDSVEDDLVRACVTVPEFGTREDFDNWADTLSEGEWRTLVLTAWELVNGARFDPKPLPASLTRSTEQN